MRCFSDSYRSTKLEKFSKRGHLKMCGLPTATNIFILLFFNKFKINKIRKNYVGFASYKFIFYISKNKNYYLGSVANIAPIFMVNAISMTSTTYFIGVSSSVLITTVTFLGSAALRTSARTFRFNSDNFTGVVSW